MNAWAFCRLFLRPSLLFWGGATILLTLALSKVASAGFASVALLLLGPATVGVLASLGIQEVQHARALFGVPGLRRTLRYGVGALALLCMAGAAAAAALGGTASAWVGALLAASGFACGLVLYDPLGRMSVSLAATGLLFGAAFTIEPLQTWIERHPIAGLTVVAAVTALSGWRSLATSTFRSKPFIPTLALLSFFSLPIEKRFSHERLRVSRPVERSWPHTYLGHSTRRWVQAAIYESAGCWRGGWVRQNLLWGAMIALFWLGMSFIQGYSDQGDLDGGRQIEVVLSIACRGLLYTGVNDPFQWRGEVDHWLLPWLISAFWSTALYGYPLRLRTRRLLPLSRRELSRIQYWSGFLQTAMLFLTAAFMAAVLTAALTAYTKLPYWTGNLPNYLRGMLAVMALLPLVQGLRLGIGVGRHKSALTPLTFMAGVLLICLLVRFSLYFWEPIGVGLNALHELFLFALLIACSQWLYRRWLHRQLLRRDEFQN